MNRLLQRASVNDWLPAVIGVIAIAILSAWFLDAFWLTVSITTLLWIYLCSAWNIVGGYTGQVSFGHAAFFGIGSYTSTGFETLLGWSPWIGMLAGGVLAAIVGVIIGYFPFRWRLSHLVFALLTLALGYILQFGVSGVGSLGGSNGLFVKVHGQSFWDFRFEDPNAYLAIIALGCCLVVAISGILHGSRIGLLWRTIRDNEPAAESIAVSTVWMKHGALAISAFLTALGGSFYAQYVGFIDPLSVFGVGVTVEILLLVIVGGSGTIIGPIVGPLILIPLSEGLRLMLSGVGGDGINHLLFGATLMVVIGLWPGGIAGTFARLQPATRKPPEVVEALHSSPANKHPDSSRQPVLRAEGLTKRFGGLVAVNDVSFDIGEGEILGIIGPNGAGKTTVFSMLSGFLDPTSGVLRYGGNELRAVTPQKMCKLGIARTFQIPHLFATFTVFETVLAGAYLRSRGQEAEIRAAQVIQQLGLVATKPCSTLTLAERRRLEVARALATGPTIILLDEVLAGLTPKEVDEALEMIRAVRNSGVTVALIEHNMRAVMGISDRIVALDAGEVIKIGTPAEVAEDPRVVEAYLGGQHANDRERAEP